MKKVGKYRLESTIGKGAFGEVFRGVDTTTGQFVAIKSIALKTLNKQLQKQLEVELNTLKALNSPYVIRLFDVIKTTNNVYMVMEHCGGGDLERYLAVHKRLSEGLARRWLWNLLEAFVCLHASGVIHRDIKLANILLSEVDADIAVVKLADFGFARFAEEHTLMETVLGTPMFMAPEVLTGKAYTYKVDVWSLGVLAYEMMVGSEAFQVRNIEELKRAQARGVQFPPGCSLSEEAKSLLRDLMVYDPANRLSFEAIKKHPFFRASKGMADQRLAIAPVQRTEIAPIPEDYDIVESDLEPITVQEYSFIEDPPFDLETIEDPDLPPPGPKPEEILLCLDYQCDLISTRVDLAVRYDRDRKTLISFAVFLNCLSELEKCESKLDAVAGKLGDGGLGLKGKVRAKIADVKGWLEQMQEKLTTEDLTRSVMKYEDTGLRVDDRLLVHEAESLWSESKLPRAGDESKQAKIKEALLLLTMACSANPSNEAAGRLMLSVASNYRAIMGVSFALPS